MFVNAEVSLRKLLVVHIFLYEAERKGYGMKDEEEVDIIHLLLVSPASSLITLLCPVDRKWMPCQLRPLIRNHC